MPAISKVGENSTLVIWKAAVSGQAVHRVRHTFGPSFSVRVDKRDGVLRLRLPGRRLVAAAVFGALDVERRADNRRVDVRLMTNTVGDTTPSSTPATTGQNNPSSM